MIILGIKLTHDGAMALIDNGELIFCYEMEKINNFPRHSNFCITAADIEDILAGYGYDLSEIEQIVIDGWGSKDVDKRNKKPPFRTVFEWKGKKIEITSNNLAGYGEMVKGKDDIFLPVKFNFKEQGFSYTSYLHVSGHIAAAYCTSQFSRKKEDAYILIWDGGMPPQLFYYKGKENVVENLGILFSFIGSLYIDFACAFEPFKSMDAELSVAGKAMAYMAVGKVNPVILQKYKTILEGLDEMIAGLPLDINILSVVTRHFITLAREFGSAERFLDADMLTTFQEFIKEMIIENLIRKVNDFPGRTKNLCISGGCGLNIKWNSAIRENGVFESVWIPPFPNDAGSAIGAACCHMIRYGGVGSLEWDAYLGPKLKDREAQGIAGFADDFFHFPCTMEELANLLHVYNEPVIFLNGRAEIGPRALGNRSILAPAVLPEMKIRLNQMKCRECYRPVAPICIEESAPLIFTPGNPDPYMLFEHHVKDNWKNKVPAICHLDGTARLQTVNRKSGLIFELLTHYYHQSGIPLLCNTSANFNGRGFFPDVESAMKWGKSYLIWSDGMLFAKKEFFKSSSIPNTRNVELFFERVKGNVSGLSQT